MNDNSELSEAEWLMNDDAEGAKRVSNSFECITPILNVSNIENSLDYYVKVLGFSIAWQWGEPTGFACVKRDGVEIFMCEDAQGGGACWMSIFVEDVDSLYEDYRASGANIVQPPTNFPWGVREMNIEDPDGHRFRIGSESKGEPDNLSLPE